MGTLTRSQLESEIHAFFADRTDIDSARLITWLNLAQTRIARLRPWQELEDLDTSVSTAASTKFVTLPTNTRTIYDVRLIDGANSRRISIRTHVEFDKAVPYPERYATGRPELATRWAEKLEFWRVPDAIYPLEIRRLKWPTTFTSGSDVASDLDQKDDALIMLAVTWGYTSFRQLEDAGRCWAIYRAMINEAAGEEVERPELDIAPGHVNDPTGLTGDYYLNPFVKESP